MDCDTQIHDELKNMGESSCPFCDRLLVEVDKVVESCCSEQNMETINSMNTCVNCGLVYGYDYVREFVDFYANMHMIRRKSVYHRKYHIENVLNSIFCENNIQLTHHQKEKIYKVFVKIDGVIHEVNDGHKRMISIKYMLKQLFKMLGLPYKCINVTKSKRTLTYYELYWEKVQSLMGNEIQSIINV